MSTTSVQAKMHNSGGQPLTDKQYNLVKLNTTDFNDGCICDETLGTITPQSPGYYQVNGEVFGEDLNSYYSDFRALIYKNGSSNSVGVVVNGGGSYAGLSLGANVSDVVYCDGISDYIQLGIFIEANNGTPSLVPGKTNYLSVALTGAGISGYSGAEFVGSSGYSGISGMEGAYSASGYSGYSGYSGFSSYSGISGYSGFDAGIGFMGASGYSGLVGTSGYSGISGATQVLIRVVLSADQSISYSGYNSPTVKVNYNTWSFYSGCSLDISNHRLYPQSPGYYQVVNFINFAPAAYPNNATLGGALLYKNGSGYSSGPGNSPGLINDLVYCNGTTDYVEIYAWFYSSNLYSSGYISKDSTYCFIKN